MVSTGEKNTVWTARCKVPKRELLGTVARII